MTVILETKVTCPACGHKIRYVAFATVRINKRSMRTTDNGGRVGWLEDYRCPECGKDIPRDMPLDREPYRVSDEDAVRVAEYRKRKWGIEDDGAAVERVAAG